MTATLLKIEERNIYDFFSLFAFILIIVGACLLTYFYTTEKINKCTSDPFKFSSDMISKIDNASYEYARINLYKNKEDIFPIAYRVIDLTIQNYNLNLSNISIR